MAPLPIFYKGLTPELIKKAEEELNETPQVKTEALKELRKLIKNEHIFCNMEDKYLICFLRAKKYNVQKSLKTLRNYTNLHERYSGIFTNRLPSEFKTFIDNNVMFHGPYRLPDMSHVAGLRISLIDPQKDKPEDLIAYVLTWSLLIMEHDAMQIAGVNFIFDLKGVTFHQCKSFSRFSILRFGVWALQDTLPLRIRGLHIINAPYYAKQLFNVMKLMMKKKLYEKIHFYDNDMESLHKNIPKEYLPEWYGGTMAPMDIEEEARIFYSYEDFIEKNKTHQTTNTMS